VKEEESLLWHHELTNTIYNGEARLLAHYLPDIFGYYFLQLGGTQDLSWLKPCPIRNHLHITELENQSLLPGDILSQFNNLPIASDSVDALILL